jgi:hypothetical protein
MKSRLSLGEIARVAHEVNRAYCAALGDVSQLQWDEAPEWQKKSAIAGVKFYIDNENATPFAVHNSWLREKMADGGVRAGAAFNATADGWKYGPVKDAEKKEHPCCVEYHELPTEHKAKDFIFRSVVHELLQLK